MLSLTPIARTLSVILLGAALAGCKVETSSESIPEAEGSGKAVNIRVEPLSREELKDVTNKAIDKTAEAAGHVKDAAINIKNDTNTAVDAVKDKHEAEARNTTAENQTTSPTM